MGDDALPVWGAMGGPSAGSHRRGDESARRTERIGGTDKQYVL